MKTNMRSASNHALEDIRRPAKDYRSDAKLGISYWQLPKLSSSLNFHHYRQALQITASASLYSRLKHTDQQYGDAY